MAENNGQNDQDISEAIKDFLIKEREEEEARLQQSQHHFQHQHQEHDPEEPRPRPNPNPSPRQENNQVTIVYEGQQLQLTLADVTPTAIAEHFGLEINEIQLRRNDKNKTYIIDPNENKFQPNLRPGKVYTVIQIPVQRPPPIPTRRQDLEQQKSQHHHQNNGNKCTLIANGQHQSIAAGPSVKRIAITSAFKLKQVLDIRLIDTDGNVIDGNDKQQYTLVPGETYHIVYNTQTSAQDILENDHDDDIDDTGEPFSKPMAFIAPFMISIVRTFYALSLTGDSVIFTSTKTAPKASDKKSKSKLLCSNKLSTCAYQVSYRFNTALKTIQKLSNFVSDLNSEIEEDSELFEYQKECQDFCYDVEKIVKMLEDAHEELEEFLQIVVKEMRAINPSVQSVKTSLKVETNQKSRIHEKEEMLKNDPNALYEKCDAIYNNKIKEISPSNIDLQTIASNRKSINFGSKLVETILHKLDDSAVLEDITNLLDFYAKISHCNLMHWIFTFNLFKDIIEYFEKAAELRTTNEYRKKEATAKQIFNAIGIWHNISRGVSLAANLNEKETETTDIHEIWGKLKDMTITSQYALEICQNREASNS
jgi:hypothetical protein